MDIVTKKKRSEIMSHIKNKDTKPELIVRSILHRNGFRFSLNRRDLPGSPDIVLRKYRTVIFVNGCFWHGHDCGTYKMPETNRDFWLDKIAKNKTRDMNNLTLLRKSGWRCIVVWTCQLSSKKKISETMDKIITELRNL